MLLDTHALIWLRTGEPLRKAAVEAIALHSVTGQLLVSAVSAWEIANLVRRSRLMLTKSPALWMADAISGGGFRAVPLDIATAIAAAELPGSFHRDPADRFLVATARALDVPIVTRDARILDYAAAGHVRAVPC